jgi:mannose-1-phosphate guanylyltransferase
MIAAMTTTSTSPPVFIALLAGGRGTRFWPLSRRAHPKQLLDVCGEGPMLLRTHQRVARLAPASRTLVITSEDLAAPVRSLLRLPAGNVLAEPEGRSTAAAIGLACLVASTRHPDAVVLALPADHHVRHPDRLVRLLEAGARAAAAFHAPVLLGIAPDSGNPHYGYLEPGEPATLRGVKGLVEVARFTEKPSEPRATALVARGALWNGGMFCLHAASTLEAIGRCLPRLGAALRRLRAHVGKATWQGALRREYRKLDSVSFDSGVLERIHPVLALRADVGWSDVGSWESLATLLAADADGNRSRGPSFIHASKRCLVVNAPGAARTIVVAGAEDLLVVDAGDVILVAPRKLARDPKGLLAALAEERPELL